MDFISHSDTLRHLSVFIPLVIIGAIFFIMDQTDPARNNKVLGAMQTRSIWVILYEMFFEERK